MNAYPIFSDSRGHTKTGDELSAGTGRPGLINAGHRRNRPVAAWRKATAVELATPGRTYEQIAAEVGYANRGTAYHAVQQALGSRTVEAVQTS